MHYGGGVQRDRDRERTPYALVIRGRAGLNLSASLRGSALLQSPMESPANLSHMTQLHCVISKLLMS